jgi:hypothetical protein
MQLKLAIGDNVPSAVISSTAQYNIFVFCNKCAGVHDMGISITMEDGPVDKQSIGAFYDGKNLPKSLASLTSSSITCPKTGKQSTQKNHHQTFWFRVGTSQDLKVLGSSRSYPLFTKRAILW